MADAAIAPMRQRATLRRSERMTGSGSAAEADRMRASIAGKIVGRRLDRRRSLGERREARFPGADRRVEVRLTQPPGSQSRTFRRAQGAEREFGGGEVVVGRH